MNKGWVNPWLKALVRGLASLSACAVDLSGCQVARVRSTRVWFLICFLNIFNDYSIIEWFVSAWMVWGLRAEWMLNMGTEASKGWLFCGDAARSRISQDRKNVFFEKLCILCFWIFAGQWSGYNNSFVLGGHWASSQTEGTTNLSWIKASSAARLWRFHRTGKIRRFWEFCPDCGLEKLQDDLCCDCMLFGEIGTLDLLQVERCYLIMGS